MMRAVLGAIAIAATGIAAAGWTQGGAPAPVAGATASIAGVVVDDQQPPRPVRRAIVTLTGEGLRPNRGAITDDTGRFAIRNLPAGRFRLMAERGGFVTSVYGARRPARPGTDIAVAAGQSIANLEVRLWRGAAVSGIVRDDTGMPMRNLSVEVVPAREITATGLTFSNRGQIRTNELGEFRAFGLAPGAYFVRALAGQAGIATVMSSEAEIDAVFAALTARSNQAGIAARSTAPVQVPGRTVAAAPIYFPGTPSVAEATPIVLSAGDDRGGVDFSVRRIRTASIRGAVVSGVAPAAGAFVILAPAAAPAWTALAPAPLTRDAGTDGRFDLSAVPPGDYRVLIRAPVGTPDPTGQRFGWASESLHVTGDDIDLGAVRLQAGLTLLGSVRTDAPGEKGPDLTAALVEMQSALLSSGAGPSRRGGPGARSLQPAPIRDDGTFTVTDLVPDEYTLALTGLGAADASWWLRSALFNGRDLLDGPFRVEQGQDLRGVTLVLSNRHTELSGTLTTTGGATESNVFVIAFPADAALRVPRSRRVQAVRPDSNGRFVIANLPAGSYLLCALTDVDDGEWNDPGFFDPLVAAAALVTLGEGEKKSQNLRLAK